MILEGVAYLPEPLECPEGWTVPQEHLPLWVEFQPEKVIGYARLFKDEDGVITAVAQVPEEAVLIPVRNEEGVPGLRNVTRQVLKQCPLFAIGVNDPETPDGRVVSVSVVSANANPLIEPYREVEDEVPAEGR